MKLKELLLKLKELLEEERNLFINFPVKDVDRLEELQEEKRKILLEISKFDRKEIEKERELKDLFLEIYQLNSSISALIINGLNFFEEIEKELFGEKTTYTGSNRTNLFGRKV